MAISYDINLHLNYIRTTHIPSSLNALKRQVKKCWNRIDLRHRITKHALFMYVRKVRRKKHTADSVSVCWYRYQRMRLGRVRTAIMLSAFQNTYRSYCSRFYSCVCVLLHWAAKLLGACYFPCVYDFFSCVCISVSESLVAIKTLQVCGYIVVVRISSVRLNTEEERSRPLPRVSLSTFVKVFVFRISRTRITSIAQVSFCDARFILHWNSHRTYIFLYIHILYIPFSHRVLLDCSSISFLLLSLSLSLFSLLFVVLVSYK